MLYDLVIPWKLQKTVTFFFGTYILAATIAFISWVALCYFALVIACCYHARRKSFRVRWRPTQTTAETTGGNRQQTDDWRLLSLLKQKIRDALVVGKWSISSLSIINGTLAILIYTDHHEVSSTLHSTSRIRHRREIVKVDLLQRRRLVKIAASGHWLSLLSTTLTLPTTSLSITNNIRTFYPIGFLKSPVYTKASTCLV